MCLRDFGCVLGENEDEIDRVGPGNRKGLDLLDRTRLMGIFRGSLEDGFQARGVLKLLIRVGVLVGLEGWNGMIRS